MKPSRLVVVAAAIVIAWSVGRVQGQGSGKKVIFSSAEQADYKSMGTTTEVSMAALWGDANKGAHATFTKFVPGYDAGMHHIDSDWDEALEGRLRQDWETTLTDTPWVRVKQAVRRGWDSAKGPASVERR